LSGTETIDAALAPATPGRITVTLPAAAAAFQDGTGTQHSLAGVLVNLGQQTPPALPAATAVPPAAPAGPDQGSSSVLVPGRRPPAARAESGGGAAVAGDEEPDEVPADRMPVDPETGDQAGAGLSQRACDACFASGSWMTDAAEHSGQGLAPAAAVAALGVLGGHWGAQRAEAEARRRRRFLI
jgi:hypothetical protein